MITKRNLSWQIKKKALEIGFDACGISKATYLEDAAERYRQWIGKGYHANMKYLENHFEKRMDPRKLMEGAKSVISIIVSYFPGENQSLATYQIAKYAYGDDYHIVVKKKLKQVLNFIKQIVSEAEGRVFVDSAPVMDREWARLSGLGWIGKNSLLIHKKFGSYIFIGEIIVNLELEYDGPVHEYCGTCTQCIDACPTRAIIAPKVIDCNKCISYHTIENKTEIPEDMNDRFNNYIFGCDICQDVCPWNNKKNKVPGVTFKPSNQLLSLTKSDFENLTQEKFQQIFKITPVKRVGYAGLKRNIYFLQPTGFSLSDSLI